MSAIFGIINLNNSPVKQSDLLSMQNVMDYWGPDGKYLWCEENAGIGQLQLFNTPESEHERFPLTDPSGNLVFVAACRIDNRDELFHKLNIPYEKRITLQNGHYALDQKQRIITDAELIFQSYQKYGKDCVHHLLGDWSFAVWDKQKKELFLARDHYGVSSMYYTFQNNIFVFSSSLKGMKVLNQFQINELRIAEILLSIPDEGENTIYKNVYRMPPGSYLHTIDYIIVKKIYWPNSEFYKSKNKTKEEYIQNFNDLFRESVSCRLRTHKKVGSTLTSGLDSNTVSVFAAEILEKNHIEIPVFTAAPKFNVQQYYSKSKITDESVLAQKTASMYSNMSHYIINSLNISPLEGTKLAISIHDQPVIYAGNAYWIYSIMEKAKEFGCSTILTGQGGNATISWPLPNAHQSYINYFKNIAKNHIKHLVNICFSNNIRLNSAISKKLYYNNFFSINKRLFQKSNVDLSFGSTDTRNYALRLNKSISGSNWNEISSWYGMDMRDPTTDKRIVEYCLSCPDKIFMSKNDTRLLIKDSMKSRIPDDILYKKGKGLQTADVIFRIIEEQGTWITSIEDYSNLSNINDILNLTFLHRIASQIKKMPVKSAKEYRSILVRGTMIGEFLKTEKNKTK